MCNKQKIMNITMNEQHVKNVSIYVGIRKA